MNLSEHFTLDELTHTDHREFDNVPNESELANLKRLAAFLETVKSAVGGKPIIVNSAFRSKQVNDAIKSSDRSQHRLGCAADIRVQLVFHTIKSSENLIGGLMCLFLIRLMLNLVVRS